jgi:3-oxoacyl-[acyl-carrier protein] reductase
MEIDFTGKQVVVTGAVRGIGRGIVHAFAERGANVTACDILAEQLDETVTTAPGDSAQRIHLAELDVTDTAAVNRLMAAVEARSPSGAVDVLVHSAGGVVGRSKQPIEQVTDADWDAIQAVNVGGAFRCARAAAPGMKRAGGGRIVIISSRAGLAVSLTGIASYGTAKSAQIGLTRQLSNELGEFGITVNSVAPGFMRTSPDYERQWNGYDEATQAALLDRIAMRRWGGPADIAHAVMFFASDYAGWVTGQTLAVTGSP